MPLTAELLPGEPILVITITSPYDVVADSAAISAVVEKALNTKQGNLYYIADVTGWDISFSELVLGLSEAFKPPTSVFRNPRLKSMVVGSSDIVALGVQAAATQEQYGKLQIELFSSMEDALKHARAEIAKER